MHELTLLDGELLYDIINNEKIVTFLIFDCMSINGYSLINEKYSNRLGASLKQIILPQK